MRAPGRTGASNERGFMLVGVVTFMLALTILGLSLFTLSSYEAQFYTVSASREQSLQNAESGMELVKVLLQVSPQRLENAQLAVGQHGVTHAMAYQWRSGDEEDTTSWGPVNWDSTVVVAITAASGGVERTIQARYVLTPGESPYKKLLTAGLGIRCNTGNGSPQEALELGGPVWQYVDSWADTSWTDQLEWSTGRPMVVTRPARPLADAFVDAKLAVTAVPMFWGAGPYFMAFSNPGGGVKFFRSPESPVPQQNYDEKDRYSFYVDRELTIQVRGTVVWVVPEGACFRLNVRVEPMDPQVQAPSTLVLVAKANQRDPGYENRGLWFQGGLTATDPRVRVYLVSEGDIGITRAHDPFSSQDAVGVSIVAGGDVELGGPAPGGRQRLWYDADTMDALTDQLVSDGALPQLTAGMAKSFVISRSTWLETTPR